MTMLLGGRVAEQLVFGSITTGAADDLQQVARAQPPRWSHEYAMGTRAARPRARRRPVQAADATRRMRDEEQARPGRPALPRRARADRREHRASSTSWPTRCSSTRCSSATTSTAIMSCRVATRQPPPAAPHRRRNAAPASDRQPPQPCRSTSSLRPPPAPAILRPHARPHRPHRRRRRGHRRRARTSTRDALGMPVAHRETVEEQGVDAILLDVGDGHVELLAPLGPETPVGKFLAKHGPGHAPRRLRGATTSTPSSTRLRGAGLRLIDETPRVGIRDRASPSCIRPRWAAC